MMKRRVFLAALISAGGLLGWRYARSTDKDTVAEILYKRLGYLRLDPAGVQRFARDFADRHVLSSRGLHTAGFWWPLYRRIPMERHYKWTNHMNYAEERIVSNYLISSDFFTNGADETKVVHYSVYYDALKHACGNPFRTTVQA